MVGEAGDFKCLRDPPQALSVKEAGFFFWPTQLRANRILGRLPIACRRPLQLAASFFTTYSPRIRTGASAS